MPCPSSGSPFLLYHSRSPRRPNRWRTGWVEKHGAPSGSTLSESEAKRTLIWFSPTHFGNGRPSRLVPRPTLEVATSSALRVCGRRDRAIYQSTSERTTPGRAGNLTRLMRSRHATVSQLAAKGERFGRAGVGLGEAGCRGDDVGAVGTGGKGGSQTCERLVIRRPHHAARRRITRALKQRRATDGGC